MSVRKTLAFTFGSLAALSISTSGVAADAASPMNAPPIAPISPVAAPMASPAPTALAAPSASPVTPPTAMPPVVQALAREGVTALQPFDTGVKDLSAYAGLAGQQPIAVYLLPDGNGIVGTRIGTDGKPLDVERVTKRIEKPLSDAMWSKLAASSWIQDGKKDAPRVVYTFSDPNCPYCHRFWEAARPWVDAGKVQLRHVLVAVIKADSVTKAAAIFGAQNPSAALAQNEQKFAQGGIKPVRNVTKAVAEKLQTNQQLMAEFGFRGTPGIVYRNDKGVVERANGMPPADALTTILGMR
ncbi:thiol:disulfide interchange protein DsbG [Pandoraea captiosa]|uniref:Thiol:disulfide interchange protein n=1 Tax=Pandoraea captiosa TaxID=2508302 RepID=A0A5E5AKG7_9BURK|nr:thiol:disulfide interchange protein DsbG [Pandoraea captiosa]VVE73292.1 thiol:disulfide interchange protein DsbG [Pandoraea captiosa]